MRTYFCLSLVSADNNVCEPEPGNDFCEVGVLSQSQFSQSNPRATARGICCKEHSSFILSWNMIGDREKSHYVTDIVSWLGFADVISAETCDSQKYICVRRLAPLFWVGSNLTPSPPKAPIQLPPQKHSDFSDPHNMGVGEGGGRGKMCRKK